MNNWKPNILKEFSKSVPNHLKASKHSNYVEINILKLTKLAIFRCSNKSNIIIRRWKVICFMNMNTYCACLALVTQLVLRSQTCGENLSIMPFAICFTSKWRDILLVLLDVWLILSQYTFVSPRKMRLSEISEILLKLLDGSL